MRVPRNTTRLSIVGLVVLALVALGLSIVALRQPGRVTATPAQTPPQPSAAGEPSASPSGDSTPAQAPTPSPSAASTSPTPSPTPTKKLTVVIVGDTFSVGAPADTWVGPAAGKLGWTNVVNLSSPGRGFIADPRSCEFTPCANFVGPVPLVKQAQPDVVITFGGTADGDFSLKGPAATYFKALRAAVPDAKLVALSPVTTDGQAPYWLTLHSQTIRAGVQGVGGTFVDVGQPGLGNAGTLSAEAHAAIAQRVVEQLSSQ